MRDRVAQPTIHFLYSQYPRPMTGVLLASFKRWVQRYVTVFARAKGTNVKLFVGSDTNLQK